MNRSEQIADLAAALAKAQAEMKAAPKSRENPHFKSKYAPLNEVIDVAKVLSKYGLSFVQPARVEESGAVTVETVLLHNSGQWLSEALTLRPQQNTPQGVGSTLTYGRRYGLSSLVGIAADEDDDGNAASVKNGNGAQAPKLSDEDRARIQGETCAEFKERIATAKDKAALQGIGAAIAEARDKGLLSAKQVEEELNLAYVTKQKALNGAQAKA